MNSRACLFCLHKSYFTILGALPTSWRTCYQIQTHFHLGQQAARLWPLLRCWWRRGRADSCGCDGARMPSETERHLKMVYRRFLLKYATSWLEEKLVCSQSLFSVHYFIGGTCIVPIFTRFHKKVKPLRTSLRSYTVDRAANQSGDNIYEEQKLSKEMHSCIHLLVHRSKLRILSWSSGRGKPRNLRQSYRISPSQGTMIQSPGTI